PTPPWRTCPSSRRPSPRSRAAEGVHDEGHIGSIEPRAVQAQVYALGLGCGLQVERDREAEFNSVPTSSEEQIERLRDLSAALARALPGPEPTVLNERIVPPVDLSGSGPRRKTSRPGALVESILHAALHLGELRLIQILSFRVKQLRPEAARSAHAARLR